MISNQGSVFDLKPKATSLPHFLFRKIEALGGHIDFRACQSVFIDKKVLVGIQLVGNPTMVSISQAIIATSINKVQACLSEPLLIQSQPVGWNFEIRIQVSPEAVPIGATSKMIYTDDDAAIVEIIQIDAGDYILRTMMPMKDFTLDREYQRKIAQRLVKLFSNYVPDLEYNLRSVFPDIRDPERAETRDLVDRYPFTHLASIPHSILSYAIPGLGHQSSVQGISFAYEESYPRFGHWGAYQAAFLSIQDWAKKVQRTDFSTILPPLAVAVSR